MRRFRWPTCPLGLEGEHSSVLVHPPLVCKLADEPGRVVPDVAHMPEVLTVHVYGRRSVAQGFEPACSPAWSQVRGPAMRMGQCACFLEPASLPLHPRRGRWGVRHAVCLHHLHLMSYRPAIGQHSFVSERRIDLQ